MQDGLLRIKGFCCFGLLLLPMHEVQYKSKTWGQNLEQAVASSTLATFLRMVGSELIQKYLGDGPKLVRELFHVVDELSPCIVFINEIDAVGIKR